MRIISLEEHFVTRDLLKATGAYGGPNSLGPFAEMQPKLLDLGAGRLSDMDEANIDVQVLGAAAMGFDALEAATGTAVAAGVNDELAEAIALHPDRLKGFAMLGMKEPSKAAAELERCVAKLGFLGAMINGTTGGSFLDAERFIPVLEAAVHLNVPIYLHPAPPPEAVKKAYYADLPKDVAHLLPLAGWGWHADTGLHTLRLICSGVFDRFPELQIIIGHMGEGLPYALARSSNLLSRAANLRLSVADYFKTNLWITTSGYFTLPPLKCALDVVGIDRLMYSVDYPFSSNLRGRSFLDVAGSILDEAGMKKLTHENAQRILFRTIAAADLHLAELRAAKSPIARATS